MRTIDRILRYNLSEHEKTCLFQCGMINGIGGEGNNIEDALRANIELLPGFNESKVEALMCDIRSLSEEHDIMYRLQLGFYKSNYYFAKGVFQLCHWSPIKRFGIFIITLIILNRYGKKFYFKNKG